MGFLHKRLTRVQGPQTSSLYTPFRALMPSRLYSVLFLTVFAFSFPIEKISAQCDNVISGGMIEADEFGCPNPLWDPSLITSVSLPTGGSGPLEFVWMMTTDDPSLPMSMWEPIPNSNSAVYNPDPISVTTYYRRCARRAGCVDYIGESNIIMKEAICCDNVTDGGEIGESQTFCAPPYDPSLLTNITSPTGGSLALEYQWVSSTTGTPYDPSNPDWTDVSGANEAEYDPGVISETTYFIRLSRRHGCIDYDGVSNMVVIQVSEEVIVNLVLTEATCLGVNDASLDASDVSGGVAPYTYLWNDPSGSTTPVINDLAAATYEVTVTDDFGCTATASQEVEDGPALQITLDITPPSCPGDTDASASVVSVNGTEPYDYLWNDPLAQTGETASDLAPGIYEISITDDMGCIGTATADVPDATPLSLTTSSVQASCDNVSDGSATVDVTGGTSPYSYSWNDPAGQTTATASNLVYGTYGVTVTDLNGCTETAMVMVTAPMQAEINITENDVTCFGFADGSATIGIVGGDPAFYDFIWDDPSATMSNTVSNLEPGTYNVIVTDTVGCMVEGSATISEPTQMVLTSDSEDATCWNSTDGTATVFASGGTPDYQYNWNAVGNPMTQTLENVLPGTYTVTVTDANGCTEETSVEIEAPSEITIVFDVNHVSCVGFADGSLEAIVSGGTSPYNYEWNTPGNPTTSNINDLEPGTYGVTVTDANGCTASAESSITEPDGLSLGFSVTDVICEPDTDGSVQANVDGGTLPYSYEWSNGETTIGISNIGIGTYGLTVTDGNGCEISSSATVDFTSTLNSSASAMDAACFDEPGGSATATGIDGTPPYSYLWSNGETTANIENLFFNSYTVTVTDADGCTSVSQTAVNAPPILLCNIDVISEVLTYDGDEGAASVSASGGVQPYNFEWSTGSNIETVTGLNAGTHSVTVTDANGCDCVRNLELENPSRIGNFIWNDENQNGIQDFNEVGLDGIVLHLTGETNTGDPVQMTTSSNTSGEYAFDGLEGGFYEIEMELPANHVLTYQDVGNDNLDSDFDPDTRLTETFVLGQSVDNSRMDGGLIVLDEFVDIGDFVWYDINHNGIQDLNEAGVAGVTVKLITMPSNQILEVTQTNQIGFYLFQDVSPGDYIVEFSMASFPTGGYILSPKDEGSDDTIDSDANEATGRTDVFTIFPFTLDNLTIDAGIYKECDNITDGGLIGYNEALCGVGADPSEIVNVQYPSGGYGTIEYLWMMSTVPIYNGPGDPNWSIIPNSNSESYDPGPISVTSYYIRCARREGCTDYIGESNIVTKSITAYPLTQILQQPNVLCMTEGGGFEAAIAGAGATYQWEFDSGATPQSAGTRVVDPVSWSTPGMKEISLTVTRFGCSFTITSSVFIENCFPNPLVIFDDLSAVMYDENVLVSWEASGDLDDLIFVVQCAEEDGIFENKGILSGQDAQTGGRFSFVDESPNLGENIYRIRYQTMSGPEEDGYSGEAMVNYHPNTVGLVAAYPNPASTQVTIELLQPSDEASILKVVNTLGKVVETIDLAPNAEKVVVDISSYDFGLYLFELQQPGMRPQINRVFKVER